MKTKGRSKFSTTIAISLVALLSLPLLSLLVPQDVYAQLAPGIKTYTLREYGIVFEYPERWGVEAVSGSEVDFSPPTGSVSVAVSDATGYNNLKEFTNELVAYYKALLANLEVVESVDLTFAGHTGHRLVLTASQGETEVKLMQVYTIIENKAYVITYGDVTADYPTSLADVNNMIKSFKIDSSIIPVKVSGAYVNDELGLQLDLPKGWNGLQTRNENGTQVVLVPGDGRKLSMVLVATNASMSSGGTGQDPFAGCDHSYSFHEINNATAFTFEGECDREEGFVVMKAYTFGLEDGLLIAMLVAPSRSAFNSGLEEFDNSIQTLSLETSVNVLSALIHASIRDDRWANGVYVNSEDGLSMKLPEGWSGYENTTDGHTQFIVLPPLSEKVVGMIAIDVFDMSSYDERNESEVVGNVEYTTLNGYSALRAEGEGEVQNVKLNFKGYILTTEDKIVAVHYLSTTQGDYEAYASEFEKSLQTLNIKDTIAITAYVPLSVDFNVSEDNVMVDDKPYAVKVASTSNVTSVELNQEERQLSLTLEDESVGNGTSFVTVGAILEGPYVVTVDGTTADFEAIDDSMANQTTLVVNHSRDTQNIVVAGTRVVPEFPIAIPGAIATIVGLVVALTRFTTRRLRSHETPG